MTELWEKIGLVAVVVVYSTMLFTVLHASLAKTLAAMFARIKKRQVEDILLAALNEGI